MSCSREATPCLIVILDSGHDVLELVQSRTDESEAESNVALSSMFALSDLSKAFRRHRSV